MAGPKSSKLDVLAAVLRSILAERSLERVDLIALCEVLNHGLVSGVSGDESYDSTELEGRYEVAKYLIEMLSLPVTCDELVSVYDYKRAHWTVEELSDAVAAMVGYLRDQGLEVTLDAY